MFIDIEGLLAEEGIDVANNPVRRAKLIELRQKYISSRTICDTKSPATKFRSCKNVLGAESILLDKLGTPALLMCGKCMPKCLDLTTDSTVIGPEMNS